MPICLGKPRCGWPQGEYREARVHSGSLYLHENLRIYGGFLGNETLINQRDWTNNPTVIDGSQSDNGNPAAKVVMAAEQCHPGWIYHSRWPRAFRRGHGCSGRFPHHSELPSSSITRPPTWPARCLSFRGPTRWSPIAYSWKIWLASSAGAILVINASIHISGCAFYANGAKEGGGAVLYQCRRLRRKQHFPEQHRLAQWRRHEHG